MFFGTVGGYQHVMIGFCDLVTAKQGRIMGFKCFPIIGFFKDCDSVPVVGIYPKLDSLQNSL